MFSKIENNKKRSSAIFAAKKEIDASNTACLLCGNKVASFCHSHSIPFNIINGMNLKNNKLCSFETIMQSETITDIYSGKKNCGIFKNICRECDNFFFKDLDDIDVLKDNWSNKDLWLQEVRILLYQIYRKEEYILTISNYLKDLIKEKDMKYNLKETKSDVLKYRDELSLVLKNAGKSYKVIYETCLDFQTNFCCATFLSLHLTPVHLWDIVKGDADKIICTSYTKDNEFYTTMKLSRDDRVGSILYLVVFPKNDKTKVILFCNEESIAGIVLDMEFQDLNTDEKKLEVLSSIVSVWGNNLYGNEKFFIQFSEYKEFLRLLNFSGKKKIPATHSDIEKAYKLMAINRYNLFKKVI